MGIRSRGLDLAYKTFAFFLLPLFFFEPVYFLLP